MKEQFLHYVWQHKLLSLKSLKTTQNEEIIIINPGSLNRNSGPDFLNGKLNIDGQTWVGNIEIHLKSSDWYLHQHENDKNYDAVILHVVWEHNTEVYMENNKPIPTLILKDLVDKNLLKKYKNLFAKQQRWIPCENEIYTINSFVLTNWLERLYFERLEDKSLLINNLLQKFNHNYEAVLFMLMAKNFGLKVNGDAFLDLASSLDFSVVRKVHFNEQTLSALLFGQAGFLEDNIEENYHKKLKEIYAFLKHKHKLIAISKNRFQFFRMRPNNFPTIRIAQLISLYATHKNLFSKLITLTKIKDFYSLFSVEVNNFWKTHYTFETSSKKSAKKLTQPFIDLLLINTVIPLKFTYLKSRGEVDENDFLNLFKQIKPEKNSIITKFSEIKIDAKNAFETQALIQLKNKYCSSKRCLQCVVGNNLLKT